MAHRPARTANDLDSLPPLPVDADHWHLIVEAMDLSPQQTRVVELVLRGACRKQIATALNISEPTIKTYLDRIFARTGTRDCMQLAMHVLAVSHDVASAPRRRPKR